MAWELSLMLGFGIVLFMLCYLFYFLGREIHPSFILMGFILAFFIILSMLSMQQNILEASGINTTASGGAGTKIIAIVDTNYEILTYLTIILVCILVLGYFFGLIKKFTESFKGGKPK